MILFISISLKENFATILDNRKLPPLAYKIRRLTLVGNCEEQNLCQGRNILSHVRSPSVFGDVKKTPSIMDFQVLRVLDLHDWSNLEDGDIGNVGNLIHLRYLSLSNSNISKVPQQIERLQHLQTLDLRTEMYHNRRIASNCCSTPGVSAPVSAYWC
jgi:Leucine-rich repeat (LRR) protein